MTPGTETLDALRRLLREAETLPRRRAELVKRLHSAGWSYTRIGEAVGVSKQRVRQWENHE